MAFFLLQQRPEWTLHHTPICDVGFYIEMGGFQYAAAIDARQRTSLRRHDMAAEAT